MLTQEEENRIYALIGDCQRRAITVEVAVYNIKDLINKREAKEIEGVLEEYKDFLRDRYGDILDIELIEKELKPRLLDLFKTERQRERLYLRKTKRQS